MSKRDEFRRLYADLMDGKDLCFADFFPYMPEHEALRLVYAADDLRDARSAVRFHLVEIDEIWRKADERLCDEPS